MLVITLVGTLSSASFDRVFCIKEDGHAAIELATPNGTCLPTNAERVTNSHDLMTTYGESTSNPGCGICTDIMIVASSEFQATRSSVGKSFSLERCLVSLNDQASLEHSVGDYSYIGSLNLSLSPPSKQQIKPLRI